MRRFILFAALISLTIVATRAAEKSVSAKEYVAAWGEALARCAGDSRTQRPDPLPDADSLANYIYLRLKSGGATDGAKLARSKISAAAIRYAWASDEAIVRARMQQITAEHPGGTWQRIRFSAEKTGASFYTFEGADTQGYKRVMHWRVALQHDAGDIPRFNGTFLQDHASHVRELNDLKLQEISFTLETVEL